MNKFNFFQGGATRRFFSGRGGRLPRQRSRWWQRRGRGSAAGLRPQLQLRRRRRRKAVERRLRKQEKAYLRRESRGPSRDDDGPPV